MAMDYIVYQLQRIGEDEYTRIPGVLVERAAKTTHRHRQSDLLSVQLSFDGNKDFKGSEIENLLKAGEAVTQVQCDRMDNHDRENIVFFVLS